MHLIFFSFFASMNIMNRIFFMKKVFKEILLTMQPQPPFIKYKPVIQLGTNFFFPLDFHQTVLSIRSLFLTLSTPAYHKEMIKMIDYFQAKKN